MDSDHNKKVHNAKKVENSIGYPLLSYTHTHDLGKVKKEISKARESWERLTINENNKFIWPKEEILKQY